MPTLQLLNSSDISSRLNNSILSVQGEIYFITASESSRGTVKLRNIKNNEVKSHNVVNTPLPYELIGNRFINFKVKRNKTDPISFDEDDTPQTKSSMYTMYLARMPYRQYAYGLTTNNHRLISIDSRENYTRSSAYLTNNDLTPDSPQTKSLLNLYPKKSVIHSMVPEDSVAISPFVAFYKTHADVTETYYKSTLVGRVHDSDTIHMTNKLYKRSLELKTHLKRAGFNVR